MADEGIAHCGQGELERYEVTLTSSSSGVSLIEVNSSPSGKGNSGVVGILCHLLRHFGRSIADRSLFFNISPNETLLGNSLSRMVEPLEGRDTGGSQFISIEPSYDTNDIHSSCNTNLLQMCFVQADRARATHAEGSHALSKLWPRSPDVEHIAWQTLVSEASDGRPAMLDVGLVDARSTSAAAHERQNGYRKPDKDKASSLWLRSGS